MSTPSPYLRDRLLQAADGLRKDAETARLSLATAEQDVAAALALLDEARQVLAEAEAHRDAQRAKVDTLAEEIAWVEERAAERTPPAYDPDAALAATGLMPREEVERVTDTDVRLAAATTGRTGAVEVRVDLDGDDLTAPGVADSRAEVAPHLPVAPRVPHEPPRIDTVHTSGTGAGQLVATSGPTVTMPDTGLNPDPLPPADVTAEARHARPARPKGSRLTGPLKALISKDGDA